MRDRSVEQHEQERSTNAICCLARGQVGDQQSAVSCQPWTALPGATCLWVPLKAQTPWGSVLKYSLCWGWHLDSWAPTPEIAVWRGGAGVVLSSLELLLMGRCPTDQVKPWLGFFVVFFFFLSFLIPLNKEYCYYWKLSFRFFPVIFKVMVMFWFSPVVHFDKNYVLFLISTSMLLASGHVVVW